jgi:hypothetical protein
MRTAHDARVVLSYPKTPTPAVPAGLHDGAAFRAAALVRL